MEEEEEEEEEAEEGSKPSDGEDEMRVEDTKDEVEKKRHAELLALPPHGSEVYIGGIPHDISEKDLRVFCRSVGEVVEVKLMKFFYRPLSRLTFVQFDLYVSLNR